MTEEQKVDSPSLLLLERDGVPRGYRRDLLKETIPSYFKSLVICGRCEGVMREACGVGDPQEFTCVACAGGDTWVSLTLSRDVITQLGIICPLQSRGCDWEGTIASADSHLNTCLYFNMDCPLLCGAVLKRKDTNTHITEICPLREIQCEYCCDSVRASDSCLHLLATCAYFPAHCENGCGAQIQRQHMQHHTMDTCPNTVVECEYSKHGCAAVMERRLMQTHNTDNRLSHMELLMQSGFNSLNEELDRVNQENRLMKEQLSCVVEEKLVQQQALISIADGFASLRHDLKALCASNESEHQKMYIYNNELMRDTVGPTKSRVDKLEEKNEEIITEVATKAGMDSIGSLSQICKDLDFLSLFQFKRKFLLARASNTSVNTISEKWVETKNSIVKIIRLYYVKRVDEYRISGVFAVRLNCNAIIRVCIVLMNQTQGVIQSVYKFRREIDREDMGSARDLREIEIVARRRITLQLVDIPMAHILCEDVCVNQSVTMQVYFDCDIAI